METFRQDKFEQHCGPFAPGDEYALRWDDPKISIKWPLVDQALPQLSAKDAVAPTWDQVTHFFS